METLYDRIMARPCDPNVREEIDEWFRRSKVVELAIGREYKKAGLEPERLPTPEMPVPPEDSKAVTRKKDRLERRVSRLMRNPACRRRIWGDIADLPIERLKQIAKVEWKEWAVRP
jgi:hypothetical protein